MTKDFFWPLNATSKLKCSSAVFAQHLPWATFPTQAEGPGKEFVLKRHRNQDEECIQIPPRTQRERQFPVRFFFSPFCGIISSIMKGTHLAASKKIILHSAMWQLRIIYFLVHVLPFSPQLNLPERFNKAAKIFTGILMCLLSRAWKLLAKINKNSRSPTRLKLVFT